MQILQAIFLALLLFGPLALAAYTVFRPVRWPEFDPAKYPIWMGQNLAGVILASFGVFWLWDRPGLEYVFDLGPVSQEFQLVLQISLHRMIWMLAFVLVLAVQAHLTYADLWKNRNTPELRFERALYLAGFHLLGGLALFNERPLLSVLFIETAVLLQHLICLGYDENENRLDRVSYFKRSVLVLFGVLIVAILGSTRLFNADTLIMAGLILYIISLVCYKHPFTNWTRTGWFVLSSLFAFFVFWRVNRLDSWTADPMDAAMVFGVLSVGILFLAALGRDRLTNFFWYVVGVVSLQMFATALSEGGDRILLPMYGIIVILAAQALSTVHMAVDGGKSGPDLWAARIILVLAHLFMVCTLPAATMPRILSGLSADTVGLVLVHLVIFLAAVSLGRLLQFSGAQSETRDSLIKGRVAMAWVVLVVVAGGLLAGGGLEGHNNWALWLDLDARPYLFGVAAATLVGLIIGQLMERGILRLIPKNNLSGGMERLIPVVDPVAVRVNGWIAEAPGMGVHWLVRFFRRRAERASLEWEKIDERFFAETVWRGSVAYAHSMSRLIRLAHQGGARQYVLFGMLGISVGMGIYIMVRG